MLELLSLRLMPLMSIMTLDVYQRSEIASEGRYPGFIESISQKSRMIDFWQNELYI